MNKKFLLLGITGAVALCAAIPAMANINKNFTKVSGSSDHVITFTSEQESVTTDGGNSAWLSFDYGKDASVPEGVIAHSMGLGIHTTSKFNFVKSVKLVTKALTNPGGYLSVNLALNESHITYEINKRMDPTTDIEENQELIFDFSGEEQKGGYEIHIWNACLNDEHLNLAFKSITVTYTC